MNPNYDVVTVLLACDPSHHWPTLFTLLVAGNFPKTTLVARQQPIKDNILST